jgi:hypothetical protein
MAGDVAAAPVRDEVKQPERPKLRDILGRRPDHRRLG